jgi:hypothetical protein
MASESLRQAGGDESLVGRCERNVVAHRGTPRCEAGSSVRAPWRPSDRSTSPCPARSPRGGQRDAEPVRAHISGLKKDAKPGQLGSGVFAIIGALFLPRLAHGVEGGDEVVVIRDVVGAAHRGVPEISACAGVLNP